MPQKLDRKQTTPQVILCQIARTVASTLALLVATMAWGDEEPAPSGAISKRYSQGFLFATSDGDFSLNLAAGIQLRHSYVDYDQAISGNEENYSNFYVRRARIWWKGHAFDRRFTYYLHLRLESKADIKVHDIWIKYKFSDLFQLGLGRNKIAYGLEFMNSGFALAMVERSVMYGETDIDVGDGSSLYPGGGTARFASHGLAETGFATGGLGLNRSQGVQVEGLKGGDRVATFEYQVGAWQGRGTRATANSADLNLYSVRAGFHPFGRINCKSQSDSEGSERYQVGLLVSAYTRSGDLGGGFEEHGYNLALVNRYRGFAADFEWGSEIFASDEYAADFKRTGFRGQLGYFVLPAKLEVVARYAKIQRLRDPTLAKAVDCGLGLAAVAGGEGQTGLEEEINELTIGLNYLVNVWYRQKLQFDLSRLTRQFAADPAAGIPRAEDQQDWRVRAVVQMKF